MRSARLDEMVNGWFIGKFEPTLYSTNDVEVAVKRYRAGEYEESHLHKIATEFTVIVSGEVEMNGQKYGAGDIVIVDHLEATDFRVLADTVSVVVKIPGASNDKYLAGSGTPC
jgi:anti-sigma factor ChrR (cupin superfamily)